jgi:hypothetical protein
MAATCILCGINPPIDNSHVVPKFVIRRLKDGNPLQTLLHSDALNQSFQDGWKGAYLCLSCEQRFSKLEAWFCNKVYDPFLSSGYLKLTYGDEFGLFVASLAFRYLHLIADKNPTKQLDSNLKSMQENLRTSLLSSSVASITSFSYLEFLFPITTIERFPPGINTYFFEAIDGSAFDYIIVPPSDKFWILYLKIPGMFFVLSERELETYMRNPTPLLASRVGNTGVMESINQPAGLSLWVEDIFKRRSVEIQANYSKVPLKRVEKFKLRLSKIVGKESSRAHQTYLLDMALVSQWETASRPSVRFPFWIKIMVGLLLVSAIGYILLIFHRR